MELFKLLGTIAVDNAQANKAIAETASEAESGGKKTDSAFAKSCKENISGFASCPRRYGRIS